jgi:hypothetical protein
MINKDFVAIIPSSGIVIVCRKTAFEKIVQILFYAHVSSFRPFLEPAMLLQRVSPYRLYSISLPLSHKVQVPWVAMDCTYMP